MRDADNIRAVAALDIDFLGFIFYPKSPRYAQKAVPETELMTNTATASRRNDMVMRKPQRVGVFVDETPQTIIAHIHNDQLDYVQLHGHELPEMIDNLKRTVIPDIRHSLKVIKAFSISKPDDLLQTKAYEGIADLFSLTLLPRAMAEVARNSTGKCFKPMTAIPLSSSVAASGLKISTAYAHLSIPNVSALTSTHGLRLPPA